MEKLKNIKVCVFDAYGTLFDVHSASEKFKDTIGSDYTDFSKLWREKQLEYSFLREIMDDYTDFINVTRDALNYACITFNIEDDTLKDNLMNSYMELSAYPEIRSTLETLKDKNIKLAILTNGSYSMINNAVTSSSLGDLLDDVISVDELKIFKPNQKVYNMVLDRFSVQIDEVAFFSSNGWDIMGATKFGFRTFWINRFNKTPEESKFKPFAILENLSSILK